MKFDHFFIKTNAIKLIGVMFLIVATFKVPYSYYELFRTAIYVLFIPLIYLLTRHKNTDHSMGIAICVLLLFVFNPVVKSTWKKADWILADYGLAILLTIWILHDSFRYFKERHEIKQHHKMIDIDLDKFKR